MRYLDKTTKLKIFVTCWLVFILHFATNIVREHYPALSLAEHGTFDVSEYVGLHPDIFVAANGEAYINNNIGASILAAVPLFLARPLLTAVEEYSKHRLAAVDGAVTAHYDERRPLRREFYRKARQRGLDLKFGLAAFITLAFCQAPLSALSAVLMFSLLIDLGVRKRESLWLSLLYAFGTAIFFRTGYLNQNLIVGLLGFFAFVLIRKSGQGVARNTCLPLLAAGFMCGFAVLTDYSGLTVLLLVGAFTLYTESKYTSTKRAILSLRWFALGAAVPLALLAVYQWQAFGHPLYPPQAYMPATEYTQTGYKGFGLPDTYLMITNLFDLRYGLFAFSPILTLAFCAPFLTRGTTPIIIAKREMVFGFIYFLAFWLFCSANQYGRMQWNTGVRYLLPVVPFLFLLCVPALLRMPRAIAATIGVLALSYSWAIAMVRESVPDSLARVFLQGFQLPWLTVLRKTAHQYFAFLENGASPLPLLALTGAVLYCLWRLPWRNSSWPANTNADGQQTGLRESRRPSLQPGTHAS